MDGYAQRPLSLWTWLIVAECVSCVHINLQTREWQCEARRRGGGLAVVTIFVVVGDSIFILAFQTIGLALPQEVVLTNLQYSLSARERAIETDGKLT